jgi:molybdopterin molybdotransferase
VPTFEEARDLILRSAAPLGVEVVGLVQTLGRVLATDQIAAWDLPMWDNSAMDGYAVRARDCQVGSVLAVRGFLPAGRAATQSLAAGTAAKILTGAPIPAGADSVVPFEVAEVQADTVCLLVQPLVGDHVREQGSDLQAGDCVLKAGTLLGPAEIAILASLGRTSVPVTRRPRVAILSTGDELLAPGEPLQPGRIFDSNGPALTAAVIQAGGTPIILPIARDDPAALRQQLRDGLQADVLVTSAGVSTGDRDLVREVLRDLGAKEAFWRVDIQPGRPMAFAATEVTEVAGRCLVFSLPGNPVAALLTFELLVRPALRRMVGHVRPIEVTRRAILGEAVRPRPDRLTLRRVRLERTDDQVVAMSSGRQATGHVRTLSRADGIALIPSGTEILPAGTVVDVQPLRQDSDFGGGAQ